MIIYSRFAIDWMVALMRYSKDAQNDFFKEIF